MLASFLAGTGSSPPPCPRSASAPNKTLGEVVAPGATAWARLGPSPVCGEAGLAFDGGEAVDACVFGDAPGAVPAAIALGCATRR
eukprot:2889092-Prymnesium_polylepis.2